jgi:hypothetical protein
MRRRVHSIALGLTSLLLALAAGCQDKQSSPAQDPPGLASKEHPAAPAIATAPEAAQHPPHFKVDGVKLKDIAVSDDTALLSIAALPPIDEWKILIVHNTEGREFRATKPGLLTGQRTMKIVKRPDQSYEFLVMQLEGRGESVRHRMPKVKVVEIQTHAYVPPPAPQRAAVLKLKIGGETRELSPEQLKAIPLTPEPGSEKDRESWLLLDVLGKSALAADHSVVLRAGENKELVLTGAQLADKTKWHMIKKNRRGQFHYREWTLTEPPERSAELRSLVEVELR